MVRDVLVEEIRERAEIVELLGEHMPLKRSGRTWRGPCPLHGGEGPNFSVDPARGLFKCFVCGEGGDVFGFFMKHLGMDFPSAVRHVAARVGIEVPEDREVREDPFGPLREVVAFAEEWFVERLRDEDGGETARRYLAGRGFTEEEIGRFRLGWAPDGWRGLRDAAGVRGIEDEPLLEVGLLATSERAEEPYDRFRGRLIFPIHDLRDRPIAFGGRTIGPSPTASRSTSILRTVRSSTRGRRCTASSGPGTRSGGRRPRCCARATWMCWPCTGTASGRPWLRSAPRSPRAGGAARPVRSQGVPAVRQRSGRPEGHVPGGGHAPGGRPAPDGRESARRRGPGLPARAAGPEALRA